MKKVFAVLVCLCLVLSSAAALAEAAVVPYDFGDFTLSLPEDIMGQMGEKADGALYFMLYPNYDESAAFHPNVNCVWVSEKTDFATLDVDAYAQQTLATMVDGFKAQGVTVTDSAVLSCAVDTLLGKDVLFTAIYNMADYTGMGVDLKTDLYSTMFVFSGDYGTYIFTISSTDLEDSFDPSADLLDTIVWKN